MAGKARTVICLLRNDLRIHDNEVLYWANKNAEQVIPLYCFDPRHFKGTYHFNFPKTGAHRMKFLIESVSDLRQSLQKRGSGLIVRRGKPELVISEIVKQFGQENIDAVALQEEVCTELYLGELELELSLLRNTFGSIPLLVTQEEVQVENAIAENCGVPVKKFWGHTLYHKADLPFSVKQLPDVYTEFRKRVESRVQIRDTLDTSGNLKPLPPDIEEGEIPTMQDLGVTEYSVDSRAALNFLGGESESIERLNHYLWKTDKVATYKETRNELIGPDYSTKFSAWLAHGCISPRYIYWEIKRYEDEKVANKSTYWVIFELIWRDYFRFVALKYGNQIFQLEGIQGKRIPWKQDMKLFEAWKEGRTGVPFVDANMREMASTGFMSNRGRQNVASFLAKDLQLDWRLGAEWFESQLIDHDVCSNYGNWLYSAGIGNDPREDRKFNMVKQGLDYDPQGDYVRLWVPEIAQIKGGEIHTVWALSNSSLSSAGVSLGETYPNPIVIAPEWSRHMGKTKGRGQGGSGRGGHTPGKTRGIDFYFKGS